MAENEKMQEGYSSGSGNQSKIAQSQNKNFLTGMFGWQKSKGDGLSKSGIDFLRVDLGNSATRTSKAIHKDPWSTSGGNPLGGGNLSERLETLFDAWLNDSTHSFNDIRERQKRLNELYFMYLNDSFILRAVNLVADEATQLNSQDRLIEVESPNPQFTERIYQLLAQWGVTQQRSRGACHDLELYAEAVWANKITDKGVERIIPLSVTELSERLEFNPIKAAESLRHRYGFQGIMNRDAKMKNLLDSIDDPAYTEDYADMFDTKLFGYELSGDVIVPPWTITHFRFNSDHSEFYPYGRPHLLGAITPFKQKMSTQTLQHLARVMSFPVTLYKVKTAPGTDESRVWEVVNQVREEYDNVGVTPQGGQSEVYSVNTRIWIPEGMLEVDVKSSNVDIDFVGDLELYQDAVAIASGIPKGYLVQEWGGWGNSAVSLVEQNKPFARHVHSIQSAFLEGLSDLIRLHLAISKEYEYDTPFTLSMRFPSEEISDEHRGSQNGSLDLTSRVLEVLTTALGLEEGEVLPDEVIRDIFAKYSFLDPTDIIKWTDRIRSNQLIKGPGGTAPESEGGGAGGGAGGGFQGGDFEPDGEAGDFDFEGGDDLDEGPELGAEVEEPGTEEDLSIAEERTVLRNRSKRLKQIREERLRELSIRYKEAKDDIYFNILQSQSITDFQRYNRHCRLFTPGNIHHALVPVLESLAFPGQKKDRKEKPKTLREAIQEAAKRNNEALSPSDDGQLEFDNIQEGINDVE